MKSYKILFIILFSWANVYYAQSLGLSNAENYISVKNYVSKGSDTLTKPPLQTVQYFDGIGRVKQSVKVKYTPQGNDLVSHKVYDEFGREAREYLPVPQPGTQNGAFYTNPLTNATNPAIYGNEKIYSEKIFESSPFDNIQKQFQVGNDWSGSPVQFGYDRNIAGEVKKYVTVTSWSNGATSSLLNISGSYGNSELYKKIRVDEDNIQVIEFIDAQGKLVLNRKVISSSENADTYYVYNEYDQLAFVIPPSAASLTNIDTTNLNTLCYQYRYDNKGRLVEKRQPGKEGWEFIVYDKQDRIVLTQDPMLASVNNNFNKKGWIFTKYDQFGRIVYTGFFANTASRLSMQTALNNMAANAANNEVRTNTPFSLNGLDIWYTKNAFPTGSMTILSVNYYDTYPFASPLFPTQILGQTVLSDGQSSSVNTKNLPLASFVKNIDDDNWTKGYNSYDLKGRLIATYSINYLGGYTKREQLLDFSGLIKESYVYHKRTINDEEVRTKETIEYDKQNRILAQKHKVNNQQEEPLSLNSYNELGQLTQKKVGQDDDHLVPLQTITYKYNIRGWVTQVNDPENLGSSFFAMKLKYQNPQDVQNGIAKYNGSVSEMDWKTSVDGLYRRYTYKYDQLNRLTEGIFLTPYLTSETQNHFYDEILTYDKNSNIKTLNRFQAPSLGLNTPMKIDELTYEYANNNLSNRLSKVTDGVPNDSGYPTGGNIIDYDLNGNMTNQKDKGISAIVYNYLNLPRQFTTSQGNISYLYRADGTKLRKTLTAITTDYLDGFQYENGILKVIPTTEGIYAYDRTQYIYNYKDHLGNIRFTYGSVDGGGIIFWKENNYYPFGLMHKGYNGSDNLQEYSVPYYDRYSGKELQETGMYDFGARFYMPDLGRWSAIDPLSEKYHGFSPYNYTLNNPLNMIDPDGRAVYPPRKGLAYWADNDGIFRWNAQNKMYEHYGNTPENPTVSNGFLGYYEVPESATAEVTANAPSGEGVIAKGDMPKVSSAPSNTTQPARKGIIPRYQKLDEIVNNPATSPAMARLGQVTASSSARIMRSVESVGKIGREVWWGPKSIGTFRTPTRLAGGLANTLEAGGTALGYFGLGFTSYQYLSGQITGTEAFFDAGAGILSFWCPLCGMFYFGGKTLWEQTTGTPVFKKPEGISNEITPLFGQPFIFK
jgi:RHS repeat-associated protein